MGYIKFHGKSSKSLGLHIEDFPEYTVPEREYEVNHVPGRNGDIIIDRHSYKNVTRKYAISFGNEYVDNYYDMVGPISAWLNGSSGYFRLEDSYDSDVYRYAYCADSFDFTNTLMRAGRATVSFICKPQRYLKSGDTPVIFTEAGNLYNNTAFDSLPIIKVNCTGSGFLNVGIYTVELNDIQQYVEINSEIQDAYRSATNMNRNVKLSHGFPKLAPGDNYISFTGDIESVEVIPKWWII